MRRPCARLESRLLERVVLPFVVLVLLVVGSAAPASGSDGGPPGGAAERGHIATHSEPRTASSADRTGAGGPASSRASEASPAQDKPAACAKPPAHAEAAGLRRCEPDRNPPPPHAPAYGIRRCEPAPAPDDVPRAESDVEPSGDDEEPRGEGAKQLTVEHDSQTEEPGPDAEPEPLPEPDPKLEGQPKPTPVQDDADGSAPRSPVDDQPSPGGPSREDPPPPETGDTARSTPEVLGSVVSVPPRTGADLSPALPMPSEVESEIAGPDTPMRRPTAGIVRPQLLDTGGRVPSDDRGGVSTVLLVALGAGAVTFVARWRRDPKLAESVSDRGPRDVGFS